ncbi:glucosaminidase, partial [Campylobacter coli]|nr:glucosaminidase [Campylobacter coli]
NGDNRDLYRRNIIALEAEIGKQLELFQWTMNNGQLNHNS